MSPIHVLFILSHMNTSSIRMMVGLDKRKKIKWGFWKREVW